MKNQGAVRVPAAFAAGSHIATIHADNVARIADFFRTLVEMT